MRKKDAETLIVFAGLAFVLLVSVTMWVARASFESATYNRLTGANTTTWDALWVELRVQEGTKQ